MRYGYWLPVFGGWLRNVENENMQATWAYVKRLTERSEKIGFDVMAFDFFQNLVRTALSLIFKVKDGVDQVLVLERADSILPAIACEQGAFAKRGLAFDVHLRGPPCLHSVFELHPKGMKVVACALRPERRKVLDVEISRLFKIMVVSDYVRTLLATKRTGTNKGD